MLMTYTYHSIFALAPRFRLSQKIIVTMSNDQHRLRQIDDHSL